jgi:hypothetical protein
MYFPGFPGCPPNWLEYSRFTVLPQDRREVPTVALERMTIGRFTLALVVAAVAVLRSAAKSPGHFPLNGLPPVRAAFLNRFISPSIM